jgi:phosphate transport system permease protein
MTDTIPQPRQPTNWDSEAMQRRIKGRYAAERRFKLLGLGAVLLSAGFLAFLLITMAANGLGGFMQTKIALPINIASAPTIIDPARRSCGGCSDQSLWR